ncbi:ap-1-like transcription factor yap1-related [Anaeramoeba flamelloides]|uniref:Ap-1-like transcription factor yap1-related n=1 Tax=Anaeramoeba flamelloides TaxID=1746091 RepID=A0AAV7ZER0_9EUKA|nr:ap-1-like transcription factor yap1-related [Anaeramoeba flamelloides]
MNQPNESKEIDKLLKLYLLSGQKRTVDSGYNQGDQNKMNPISQLTQLAPLLPALSNLFQISSMNQNQNNNQSNNQNNNLNLGNTNLNQIASLIPNLSTLISGSLGVFSNQQNFNQNNNQNNTNDNENNFNLNNNFYSNNNQNQKEKEKEKEKEEKKREQESQKANKSQTQRKRIQTRKEKQETNNEFVKTNMKKKTLKKRRIVGTKKVRRGGRQPIPRENMDPKAVERMESNRLAAREFRKREKEKINQLQDRVSKLEEINQRYRLSVSTLVQSRNRMVNELEQIQRGILTSISVSNPITNSAIFASKERNPNNQSDFNGQNNGGGGGFY